jgi:hypothetical protein
MLKTAGRRVKTTLMLAAAVLIQIPAQAHHSITGEFDTEVQFELRGTLTKLDWTNPHLWYYLDVVNDAGVVEKWQCTTGQNPNRLLRTGWKKEDLPIGTVIRTLRSNPARDQSNTCIVGGITLDDGTPVFSGTKGEIAAQ